MVIEHLNLESEQETYARNAEWGPEAADAMIERVKPFPIPSGAKGLTMADLIDETPREQISQVALEGKDAIVLANYIYSISDTKPATLTKAFQGYHEERVDSAREAYETSDRMRRLFRKRHISWLIRLLFRYIPQFVWNHIFDKVYSNRPQAAFLPLVPDRGLIKAFPQRSLDLKDTSST
ncbi:hypothetical protein BGX31_001293 [Mortierella sp. GBA43]|nr:hypothetical protein BGX31_001293 [Mortierella sp. GBA43]